MDLVKLKTAQTMFKAKNHSLHCNIQKLFKEKECGYNLRGKNNFEKHYVRTNLQSMSISFGGVTLWNSLDDEIKQSRTIILFKKKLKNIYIMIEGYREEEAGRGVRAHGNRVYYGSGKKENKIIRKVIEC